MRALDQHLDRAVRQLEELEHGPDRADRKDVRGRGIVLRGVLLGNEEDLLVVLHHVLEGADGLLPAHEERHDHVRENDNVPQRQDGVDRGSLKLLHPSSSTGRRTGYSLVTPGGRWQTTI